MRPRIADRLLLLRGGHYALPRYRTVKMGKKRKYISWYFFFPFLSEGHRLARSRASKCPGRFEMASVHSLLPPLVVRRMKKKKKKKSYAAVAGKIWGARGTPCNAARRLARARSRARSSLFFETGSQRRSQMRTCRVALRVLSLLRAVIPCFASRSTTGHSAGIDYRAQWRTFSADGAAPRRVTYICTAHMCCELHVLYSVKATAPTGPVVGSIFCLLE